MENKEKWWKTIKSDEDNKKWRKTKKNDEIDEKTMQINEKPRKMMKKQEKLWKMTVQGTIVRSEVCNAGRFCLES